jgi:hypothetical protein
MCLLPRHDIYPPQLLVDHIFDDISATNPTKLRHTPWNNLLAQKQTDSFS